MAELDANVTRRLDRLAQADEIAEKVEEKMRERGPVLQLASLSWVVRILGGLSLAVAIAGGIKGLLS